MKKETKDKIKKLIIEKALPALEDAARKELDKRASEKGKK